jgi:UDPglucose 6-dehydrogenase
MKIAIIGHGFVGKAVDYGFQCDKVIIDPRYGTTLESIYDNDPTISYAFICVPTPMGECGVVDSSILEESVEFILKNTVATRVIIKSTVTPDVVEKYTSNRRVVYNPEFLTEKSANEDFVNPFMHVFGGWSEITEEVETLYKHHSLCKPCPSYHMSMVDASFVKYGINSFLATKVVWFNQFFDVIENNGGNFGKIVSAMTEDDRVGRSHTTVPGYDGRRGAAGACFAKDIPAFINFSNKEFSILKEAWNANCDYRNSYEEMLAREEEQNIIFEKL